MYEFDLFISHSSRYTTEATNLAKQAERKDLKVFLASETIEAGEDWEDKLKQALLSSRELCVLATSDILSRQWVLMELGAAWVLERPATAIMLGPSVEDLPPPLRKLQVADYYRSDDFLNNVIERKRKAIAMESAQPLYNQLKTHPLVDETLVTHEIRQSPFVFDELIRVVRKRMFIAGQNLYTLLVSYGDKNKELIFGFLREDSERAIQILVCDPECKYAVQTWKKVTAREYEDDLRKSISSLEEWSREASKHGLKFEAKKTPIVPVTITFVDPEDPDGKLVAIPNVYESTPGARPAFFLYRSSHHERAFLTYWENYRLTYERATPIYQPEQSAAY